MAASLRRSQKLGNRSNCLMRSGGETLPAGLVLERDVEILMSAPKANVRDAFDNAVSAIYQSALDPLLWPPTLQAIADLTDDIGAILIYGKDDGAFGVICSNSLDDCVVEYGVDWSHRDVRANRSRERGYFAKRDVITDRDIVTPVEMAIDPFYSEFLQRHGLKYFAAAMVSPDPHIDVALSVQRKIGKHEFNQAELDLLQSIGQHVERSLRLGIRLMDAELAKAGLGHALDRVGIGVFILDSMHRVIYSNEAAELISRNVRVLDERISVSSIQRSDSDTTIRKLLEVDAADPARNHEPILMRRSDTQRPLALYVLPISDSADPSRAFLTHARTILLVVDPDSTEPPDPTLVRDLLGLTLGEARVASLIGHGISPRKAAARLGITEETARGVLKRVFLKAGISRQSELTALMTRLIIR